MIFGWTNGRDREVGIEILIRGDVGEVPGVSFWGVRMGFIFEY